MLHSIRVLVIGHATIRWSIHTQQFTYSSQFRWGSIEFVAESGDTLSYYMHLYMTSWGIEVWRDITREKISNIASHILYLIFLSIIAPKKGCREALYCFYIVSVLYALLLWYYVQRTIIIESSLLFSLFSSSSLSLLSLLLSSLPLLLLLLPRFFPLRNISFPASLGRVVSNKKVLLSKAWNLSKAWKPIYCYILCPFTEHCVPTNYGLPKS